MKRQNGRGRALQRLCRINHGDHLYNPEIGIIH